MVEEWIETGITSKYNERTVVAYSNKGNVKLANGHIESACLRLRIRLNGQKRHLSRLIAETFIPKTAEDIALGRDEVDHISHNPEGINVNDIRNLRWVTHAENIGMTECRTNMSMAHKGKPSPNLGKTFPAEHRRRMSEAQKKRWAKVKGEG